MTESLVDSAAMCASPAASSPPDLGATWSLQRAPAFAAGEFERWRNLIEAHSGLAFSEARETYLRTVLADRIRRLRLPDYESYLRRLDQGLGDRDARVEWHRLIDTLTIQETRFFRDAEAYAFAERHLRDRIRGRHARKAPPSLARRPLQLWSMGCSTGEEAYSLAILAEELTYGSFEPGFGVWATDISAAAIRRARAGIYPEAVLPQFSRQRRMRCLGMVGVPEGSVQVVERLRSRVCCARANLLEAPDAGIVDLDLVFCQNVLIYFRKWRRREVLDAVAARLAPGGAIVIGPGDVQDWVPSGCERARDEHVLAFVKRADHTREERTNG